MQNLKIFQRDLTDFEKHIRSKYQKSISDIQVKTCFLNKNSSEISKAINKQGDVFHREIGTAIENMKFDMRNMDTKHLFIQKIMKIKSNALFQTSNKESIILKQL